MVWNFIIMDHQRQIQEKVHDEVDFLPLKVDLVGSHNVGMIGGQH